MSTVGSINTDGTCSTQVTCVWSVGHITNRLIFIRIASHAKGRGKCNQNVHLPVFQSGEQRPNGGNKRRACKTSPLNTRSPLTQLKPRMGRDRQRRRRMWTPVTASKRHKVEE